jgi:Zn-dependent peptidase ImmA (M78 family)
LFEYLYVKEKMTSLVTDANTEQQKRNRAFAAELLAPAAVLKDQIRTPRVTLEKVDEIAEEFGVSSYVIVHQLNNHGIASVYPG